MRCLPVEHNPMHRPALSRAAPDHSLDAVPRHELERACGAALDRLPALDRQIERARAKSSASRNGCHLGVILKPQPILMFLVWWARCNAMRIALGMHSVPSDWK